MAKRPNSRLIKAARSYAILEAADALGVSVGTVRGWIRMGLPAMTAGRPYLVHGSALRAFLEARRSKTKTRLGMAELFCMTCKQGRLPLGMMVDCHPQTGKTARLSGLCSICGGTCNRMVSKAKLGTLVAMFDIAYRGSQKA